MRSRPNLIHVSAPDFLGHRAVTLCARQRASRSSPRYHTRFETYPRYYGLGFLEPVMIGMLKRFYNRVDEVLAPSQMMGEILREWGVTTPIGTLVARGRTTIASTRRAATSNGGASLGIADDEIAVGFLGRLVKEKGLDVFAEAMHALDARGVPHKTLVVGEGPARDWFAQRVPDAVFAGFQSGDDLGRAVASMDVFFNPSVTETFGNVTLEAMAARRAGGRGARDRARSDLIDDGVTGLIVAADAISRAMPTRCALSARTMPCATRPGAAGHAKAARYRWETINQAVLDAYLEVMARQANTAAPEHVGAARTALRRLPVERQRRLAEGEAIEMARDRALQSFELLGDVASIRTASAVVAGVEGDQRVARPVGAARILGEDDRAVLGGEFDREIVLPVLAQLLEIFAGARGRHAGGCTDHGHCRPFADRRRRRRERCPAAGAGSAGASRPITAARSSAPPRRSASTTLCSVSASTSLGRAAVAAAPCRDCPSRGGPGRRWSARCVAPRSGEPREQRLDLFRMLGRDARWPASVIANSFFAPSAFCSSIRPMSSSMVSVG